MVIKGTVTQSLTPGVSWSPRGGRLEEARVQILHADLAAYETTAQAAGYEYRYEPVGNSPVGVFSYKRPQASQIDEDLSDTWAVRYITEQRDIWLDDLVVAQMATIATADARARFKADIEAMLRGETSRPALVDADGITTQAEYDLTTADIIAKAGKEGDAAFTAMTNALVDDLSNGVTSQFVSTPALVRSSVRPAFTSLQPVFSYINSLCTTAGLLAYETTIPSNLAAALTGTLSAYYWLMQAPTMEQQEDGRWRYQREYWGVPRIANLLTDRIVTPT
jgi:hypothetical protein